MPRTTTGQSTYARKSTYISRNKMSSLLAQSNPPTPRNTSTPAQSSHTPVSRSSLPQLTPANTASAKPVATTSAAPTTTTSATLIARNHILARRRSPKKHIAGFPSRAEPLPNNWKSIPLNELIEYWPNHLWGNVLVHLDDHNITTLQIYKMMHPVAQSQLSGKDPTCYLRHWMAEARNVRRAEQQGVPPVFDGLTFADVPHPPSKHPKTQESDSEDDEYSSEEETAGLGEYRHYADQEAPRQQPPSYVSKSTQTETPISSSHNSPLSSISDPAHLQTPRSSHSNQRYAPYNRLERPLPRHITSFPGPSTTSAAPGLLLPLPNTVLPVTLPPLPNYSLPVTLPPPPHAPSPITLPPLSDTLASFADTMPQASLSKSNFWGADLAQSRNFPAQTPNTTHPHQTGHHSNVTERRNHPNEAAAAARYHRPPNEYDIPRKPTSGSTRSPIATNTRLPEFYFDDFNGCFVGSPPGGWRAFTEAENRSSVPDPSDFDWDTFAESVGAGISKSTS
ncbi:MAG: hypothetical protein Q9160_004255 [Pyrenula sp. 1 TL-2023]